MGNLGNFHVQSQILTGKKRDTTKQLCENRTLAHRRHQLAISVFLIHHVQMFFFPEKTWDKKGICEILMPEGQS
jgi:hypothetical protein